MSQFHYINWEQSVTQLGKVMATNKQQYGIILGDTALWQVWHNFMTGVQNQKPHLSPLIEQEYWQSLSYLSSTAEAGSDKIKARI